VKHAVDLPEESRDR